MQILVLVDAEQKGVLLLLACLQGILTFPNGLQQGRFSLQLFLQGGLDPLFFLLQIMEGLEPLPIGHQETLQGIEVPEFIGGGGFGKEHRKHARLA